METKIMYGAKKIFLEKTLLHSIDVIMFGRIMKKKDQQHVVP